MRRRSLLSALLGLFAYIFGTRLPQPPAPSPGRGYLIGEQGDVYIIWEPVSGAPRSYSLQAGELQRLTEERRTHIRRALEGSWG